MAERLNQQTIAPEGMRALGGLYHYVAKSNLSEALLNLVYLRVSQINGCAFCIAAHSRDLLSGGVAAGKLMLLSSWRETGSLFSAKERMALQWAESVTLIAQTGAPDSDYQAALDLLGEKDLVDLTLAIGLINAYNRLGVSFRRLPEGLT
jgi:AhpD family alkylhydroperoxidase